MDIEKLEADKFSIFRKCKLEEIYLPLLGGTLDDIPIEENVSNIYILDEFYFSEKLIYTLLFLV